MSGEKVLFHVTLIDELAIAITKDPSDNSLGFSVKIKDNTLIMTPWELENDQMVYFESISIKKGSEQDFLLHPRSRDEISELLGIKDDKRRDRLISLTDLLESYIGGK